MTTHTPETEATIIDLLAALHDRLTTDRPQRPVLTVLPGGKS